MLNVISLVGLFAMVAIAWTMSSNRANIRWRSVGMGILLQLAVAAVLFNSQSWKFSRTYHLADWTEFRELLETKKVDTSSADVFVASLPVAGTSYPSADALSEQIDSGNVNVADVNAILVAHPLVAPRFAHGVLFYLVEQFFAAIRSYVEAGSVFVFNLGGLAPGDPTDPLLLLKSFAFGVLPTVIFFASLMSVLYYVGVMKWVVEAMAWVMQKVMGTSGAESLAAAANVLIGQTEAPLVIRPYIAGMTRSELNALMVGGFATISGSLMAIFVTRGISAGHLLSASIISAPAALVIAKVLQPETESPATLGHVSKRFESDAVNVIDAAAQGASDGMRLAINVTAMLIAFLALLKMIDSVLWLSGEGVQLLVNSFMNADSQVDYQWSLNGLLGMLFYPLAWLMGITPNECHASGQLLGTKMVANEFVAYMDFGSILDEMKAKGTAANVQLSERTQIILTYALCGFSNFASIGIQIGGIGALAPDRRSDLAQLGLRAMIGGMLACCMTACVAGLLQGILH